MVRLRNQAMDPVKAQAIDLEKYLVHQSFYTQLWTQVRAIDIQVLRKNYFRSFKP